MLPIRDHNPSGKFPLVTLLLILTNSLAFFLELTSTDIDLFIRAYALIPREINLANLTSWQPFFTSMFLHAGWVHLVSNMWFLFIFGDNIEARLGKVLYLFFYLASGLAAGLVQFLTMVNSAIPVLGASGAIAGILGAYMVFYPRARIETLVAFGWFYQRALIPAYFMLFYWFIIQLFAGAASVVSGAAVSGGVAWFAHAGGFVTGYLLANMAPKMVRP